jgi:hypothetical protein
MMNRGYDPGDGRHGGGNGAELQSWGLFSWALGLR